MAAFNLCLSFINVIEVTVRLPCHEWREACNCPILGDWLSIPLKDDGNCLWSRLWVVSVTSTVFFTASQLIYCVLLLSVCLSDIFVSDLPQLYQLTWMRVQALDSVTMRRQCGLCDYVPTMWRSWGGDVDRNDTCYSSPVNGSILAITPGCASDHIIEFWSNFTNRSLIMKNLEFNIPNENFISICWCFY